MVQRDRQNAKKRLSTADKSDRLSVDGVGLFGNFNNVKRYNKVSIDLMSEAKLGEVGFYSVVGISEADSLQIYSKRTNRIVKHVVINNGLF